MDKVLRIARAYSVSNRAIAIFAIWLFHVTPLVGTSLGFQDWFISKTPLNLLILLTMVVALFPLDNVKRALVATSFFFIGMFVEWAGVHSGLLFGEYVYGSNLGWKFDGVPVLIGVNWAILTLITAAIASKLVRHWFKRVLLGASLMVFMDLFIEVAAPKLDYWSFSDGAAPFENYAMWFFTALGLHTIYQRTGMSGDLRFSLHLYAAQLLFFVYFYALYTF